MTPKEEILMLRELLKKQNDELKQKDDIIEKNAATLAKKNDIIAQKDDIIRRQNIQIENMMQALLHARKKMFGRSSETTNQCDGQLSLFDTTEALAGELLK